MGKKLIKNEIEETDKNTKKIENKIFKIKRKEEIKKKANPINHIPTLYVMIGCPGSGKTTYIKNNIKEGQIHISRDDIRNSIIGPNDEWFSKDEQVFNKFINEINSNLKKRFDVYADATHITKGSRWKLLTHINQTRKTVAVYIKASFKTCLQRNNKRTGRALTPEYQMRNMYDALVSPSYSEGFDDIIYFDNDK